MSVLVVGVRLLLAAASLAASGAVPGAAGDTYYNASACQKAFSCGGVDVHYPFFLANATAAIDGYTASSSSCGYPGMAVSCDGGRATLRLGGDSYVVLNVSYDNHTVTVADADVLATSAACPRVTHNVTVPPETWFKNPTGAANDNLSLFFDCAFTTASPPPANIDRISCDSLPGVAFVAAQVGLQADQLQALQRACMVFVVPVLRDVLGSPDYAPRLSSGGYGEVLRRGFQLSWDPSAGPCFQCEKSKGQCSYNQSGGFLGCLCSDGRVRHPVCGTTAVPAKSTSKTKRAIAIGASMAAGVLLLLLVVMSFLYLRKRRQYKMTSSSRLLKYTASGGTPRSMCSSDMESGSIKDLQTHHYFTYEELEEATDSFNGAREVGDGGFGTVYKGHLRDGRVVAVKRLYNKSCRRVEQFVNEAVILSRLRHPNLVAFYGCTSSRSRELLLVYEFVPNGTVADHLHGHRAAERALGWPLRLRIAVETAAALAYLHAVEPPVVHRDVKTNNILLDSNFHVKVADFGLSRLFPRDVTHVSTAPQGTPGYVDPEYHQCYQLTDRSDVYSFGVVLAELISSKPAVDVTRGRDEINLSGMAISKIQRRELEELVDLELGYGSDPATTQMMTMVAELAFRCLQQNGEMRPPIREVLDALRSIQDEGLGKKKDALLTPRSPDTVHAPWQSVSTTPSVSQ